MSPATEKNPGSTVESPEEVQAAYAAAALAAELSSLKATVAALEKRIERDAEVSARKQAVLETNALAVRRTLSFQLGNLLINGFRSPRALIRLPADLLTLRAEAKKRRAERDGTAGEASPAKMLDFKANGDDFATLLVHFNTGGMAGVAAFLAGQNLDPRSHAAAFTQLARHLQPILPDQAAEAARAAYERDPRPYRAKWLAFRLFDAGCISEPAKLLAALVGTDAELSVSEQRRAEEIQALARLHEMPPRLLAAPKPVFVATPGAMLYVAASAMPYHTSGYTVRTHELVRAMSAAGLDVTVLTRPGYPWDRRDSKGEPSEQQTLIDDIVYVHCRQPSHSLPLDIYFEEAARAIAKVAKEKRVQAIHAASNHVNALPALMAARSLGIPFIYEMRGVWELSRASKVLNYERSERFQIGVELEAYVAKNADRVYVISKALGAFIQDWGVNPARVAVLPNCINVETISKAEETQAKIDDVFTVGYAGAIVGYEGLDVLIEAIALLKARGQAVNARLIGDGDMRTALGALAAERGVHEQVSFLGKLAPDEARALLAETNVVAIPRKPHQVCEIVPPIKLIEAMALGMPVIVPNLPVFAEEVQHEETGLLFKAGDAADLAHVIEQLMTQPHLVATLGANARLYASTARVWGEFAKQIKGQMESFHIARIYSEGGHEAVVQALIARYGGKKKSTATALIRASKSLAAMGHTEADYPLAQAALSMDRSEGTLRGAFWAIQRAKDFAEAHQIIAGLEVAYENSPTPKGLEQLGRMKASPSYMLTVLKEVCPRRAPQIRRIPNKVCYVLHNTLPFSSGGYATRSHGVATGLRAAGWDVVVLSRPGFPVDIKSDVSEADVASVDTIDGIPYVRTLTPKRKTTSGREYVLSSADAIEARLREQRPSIVIAASNYLTALPTLIAARRLGLPFVYEVRGLWEITRLSREAEFGDSAAFEVLKTLEAATGELADHVFTLTEPMREELAERGIPYSHIDLLPNSCDPTRFNPVPRNEQLAQRLGIPAYAPVIGYIGTFVDYEGLENLAMACALLKQRGVEFRLLMVGNENTSDRSRGPITEQIVQISEKHGFSEWLILTGRVPHEEVESYYSLVDIAPFPRKPLPVCEMVSPMKPLEALAMEKAVVVSSVRALVEMVQDEKTGLVFKKGNVESLAATLARLIESPELRTTLGANGRKWVERERTWAQIGEKAGGVLTRLVETHVVGAA